MAQDTLILVVGATGQQGGAVARHLLRNGIAVRALTRNVNSSSAKSLAVQGVQIAAGNLDDEASLEGPLEGVSGVFSVQNYWERGVGYEGEIQQGKDLRMRPADRECSILCNLQWLTPKIFRESGISSLR
jgi:uncharacterized protein YbjT (DUF2867 family)